ncbi:hypothetical protein [Salaquimonas pukyongi]|uniref:hypothetical protein n=1 Tax=Salaquimonas pukyongi TaxID=2712698 RepID=UPI00096B9250|nr:hypothetical protein [Salaquimonas pukyongi]
MSDSPDKENNGRNTENSTPQGTLPKAGAGGAAAAGKPGRIPLPFTILTLLLITGITLFGVLFALQFFHARPPAGAVPKTLSGPTGENPAETPDDGAPVSILPDEPAGITVLEKQAEAEKTGEVAPTAPIAQGAGIATGFAMDLGAADSFIELTQRFSAIVSENGESNFLRLEPRAVLRETVTGLEARLLVGPFDSEAEAADACKVLILGEGIDCTPQPFEGELIARQ